MELHDQAKSCSYEALIRGRRLSLAQDFHPALADAFIAGAEHHAWRINVFQCEEETAAERRIKSRSDNTWGSVIMQAMKSARSAGIVTSTIFFAGYASVQSFAGADTRSRCLSTDEHGSGAIATVMQRLREMFGVVDLLKARPGDTRNAAGAPQRKVIDKHAAGVLS